MKKINLIILVILFAAFNYIASGISYAQEETTMCDYKGYFKDDGTFYCSVGSLACEAPCPKKKELSFSFQ